MIVMQAVFSMMGVMGLCVCGLHIMRDEFTKGRSKMAWTYGGMFLANSVVIGLAVWCGIPFVFPL